MKKSCIFAVTLLLFSIVSCSCAKATTKQVNDSLSIYISDYREVAENPDMPEAYQDYVMNGPVRAYKEKYPNVTITIYDPTEGDANMSEEQAILKLNNDLMTGKGPDVVVLDPTIRTFKMMSSGAFCDLRPYMEADSTFVAEEYIQPALDAGMIQNKQYIIPLSISLPLLLSTEDTLKSVSLNPTEYESSKLYVEHAMRNAEENKIRMDSLPNEQRVQWSTWAMDMIDYEKLKSNLNQSEIKNFINLQKSTYQFDKQNGEIKRERYEPVINKRAVFMPSTGSIDNILVWASTLGGFSKPKLTAIRNSDDQLIGTIKKFAAVRSTSSNQENGYHFIRLFLDHFYENDYYTDVPVCKKSASTDSFKQSESLIESFAGTAFELTNENGDYLETFTPIAVNPGLTKIKEQYLNYTNQIDKVVLSNDALQIVNEHFKQYYTGEKDYEACLSEAQNELDIYMSE